MDDSKKAEGEEDVGKNRFRDKAVGSRRGLGDCSEGLPKDPNPQQVSSRLNRARETSPRRTKRR